MKKMVNLVLVLVLICFLGILIIFLSLEDDKNLNFIVYQHSYHTTCAEEDNVALKIVSVNDQIEGINILARKPVIKTNDVFNKPDFSECHWATNETTYYDPTCPAGYIDENNLCRPEVSEIIFDNGKWRVIGETGIHWQPFMRLLSQDNQRIGEYMSLTIKRLEKPEPAGDPLTTVVIYSDGYLRPNYFSKPNELHSWGGSFVLGNSKLLKLTTQRFHNNIEKMKILNSSDKNIEFEIFFAENQKHSAKLVIYYDYNQKGIDFYPPEKQKELLTFVSMYKNENMFDVEKLVLHKGGEKMVYNVIDHSLDKAIGSKILLKKDHLSKHNTLAPDFAITGIDKE